MHSAHFWLATIALGLLPGYAYSQSSVDLSLRAIPAQIAPGQNAFIEVRGTFPDACTFGQGELSFAQNVMADNEVQVIFDAPEPDSACGAAITDDVKVFGPIPFESDGSGISEMRITFDWQRGDLTGFGDTTVAVSDTPAQQIPESGTWWLPDQPGHGLSIEAQGDQLFAVAYSYDEEGENRWATTQGTVQGGLLSATWRRFSNGSCWLCNTPYQAPVQEAESREAHFAFAGPAGAYLRIGDTPGEALQLQRFHLTPADQVSDFSQTVTMPDLSGWWVLVDDGETPQGPFFENVFEFVPNETETDGEITFVSEPVGVAITCYANYLDEFDNLPITYSAGTVICEYTDGLPGTPPTTHMLNSEMVGQDQIQLPNNRGVILRVPSSFSAVLEANQSP